jgi:hypothetical protein
MRAVFGMLGQRLVDAGWKAGDDQMLVVDLSADFADTHEWLMAGYSTAGRCIADMLDVTRRTANDWIRVGRALRNLPATAAALRGRRISFSKAKVLTRTASAGSEEALVDLARSVPTSELPKAIAAWSQKFEPDHIIDACQLGSRSLTWQTQPDGMLVATVRFTPDSGAVLTSAVDSAVMRTTQTPHANPDPDAFPSLAQQRADAMLDLLAGTTHVATEVVIHVRGDGATLDDGSPITQSAVAQLLPTAFVRVLIHDAERRPINASSRQRHPSSRQRRLVKERDRCCVDCGSFDLLEFDHVPAFSETGRTVVEELELRCAPCHRHRHSVQKP